MHRRTIVAGILLAIGLLGCSTAPVYEAVRVEPGEYAAAFDAALAVASTNRLPAVVRDRRAGLIEAGPASAASIFEPWSDPGATLSQRMERTIQHYRRRARIEFVPAGDPGRADDDPVLAGADVLGLGPVEMDRTTWDGPLEIRVRVFLEQSHRPGLRPDTWSRGLTTYAVIVTPGREAALTESEWSAPDWFARHDDDPETRRRRRELVLPATWTPVVRDTAFEQRLLAEMDRRLHE